MTSGFHSRIEGVINADEIYVGKGVIVEEGVLITGQGGPARKVVLGDFSYTGRQTRIIVPEFRLGDYTKFHAFSFAHGQKPMQIGRNCRVGTNVTLDSVVSLYINDNVAIWC